MTDTEAGLLQAILSNPAEDDPRLRYADWLQENDVPVECPRCTDRIALAQTPYAYDAMTRYWNPDGKEKCPVCGNGRQVSGDRAVRSEFIKAQIVLHAPESICCRTNMGGSTGCITGLHCPNAKLRDREKELRTTPAALRRDGFNWPNGFVKAGNKWDFSRGFVSTLTCTAADWLAHHDALFWSPKQTVPCPDCDGTGELGSTGDYGQYIIECRTCKPAGIDYPTRGTGQVPRPFVPTAQPLEHVILTTTMHIDNKRTERGDDDMWLIAAIPPHTDDPISRCLRANDVAARARELDTNNWVVAMCDLLWPGIRFTLNGA